MESDHLLVISSTATITEYRCSFPPWYLHSISQSYGYGFSLNRIICCLNTYKNHCIELYGFVDMVLSWSSVQRQFSQCNLKEIYKSIKSVFNAWSTRFFSARLQTIFGSRFGPFAVKTLFSNVLFVSIRTNHSNIEQNVFI